MNAKLGLGMAVALVGCGLGAGDYEIYRVGSSEASSSGDCSVDEDDSTTFRTGETLVLYLDAEAPYLDAGGLVLAGTETDEGYTFAGESVELESFGGQTILDSDHDGLEDGLDDPLVDSDQDGLDDFAEDDFVDVDGDGADDRFEDDIVDEDGDGEDDRFVTTGGDTLRTTTAVSVSIVIEGDTISGVATQSTTSTCEGECQGFDTFECTETSSFDGVRLDDAVVEISP